MTFAIQPIDSTWSSQVTTLCYTVSQWDRDTWKDYLRSFPDVAAAIKAGEQRIRAGGCSLRRSFTASTPHLNRFPMTSSGPKCCGRMCCTSSSMSRWTLVNCKLPAGITNWQQGKQLIDSVSR